MAGRGPQGRGLDDVPDRIPDCLPEPVAHPAFPVVGPCCACGQDVDVLGVYTQKFLRLDCNLTNSTHNRLVTCLAVGAIGSYRNLQQC
jgi:hypothetical protein